ncbi:hypothetical protein EG328_002479 [Venturia inaequalis]|uniref:C2H2-type domain-containing protein n=1 Tax=Venturia inaequalis TaxID=5025 RepID=A0A8H3VEC3_VENIN|nr:hypothetical protein EG328_002479 [Venturia inaequalis]
MEYHHGLDDLTQIRYPDDLLATSRWPYHIQASSGLMSQQCFSRSPMLAGIGLHSDATDYDFPLADINGRHVQGLNAPPFSSGLLYADRKTSDFALYPLHNTTFPEIRRQCSPLTDGSSSPSQTCDTFSASHTDELYQQYSMEFKHSVGSCVEFSQGCFPHGGHVDFSRRPSDSTFGGGCSISLDQIQNFQDTFDHDHEHVGNEIDAECDSDDECHDIPPIRQLSIMPYLEDEGIGESIKDESIRDSMSDRFDDDEEEEDDPEYNPKSSRRNPRSTRTRPPTTRRPSHTRNLSTTSSSPTKSRISKPTKSRKYMAARLLRPFPCPLAEYGCQSTFTSKNEWKRHVSTQHIKLGFWRCDMCPPTTDQQCITYNDFNRKDLFTQHLRRMHATHPFSLAANPISYADGRGGVSDEALRDHQGRCYITLRCNPLRSGCLFCSKTFQGEGSWEERMEHVGAHLEAERKRGGGSVGCEGWRGDAGLRDWLEDEGLIERGVGGKGEWRVGDGRPRRRDSVFG